MSNIGNKRQRITIQRDTGTTQDDFGQLQESWSDVATRWASVKPLSSTETTQADQVQGLTKHEIRLRYDSTLNITLADRISYDSRILNISSVINEGERNVEYVLQVTEEV